MMPVPTVNSRPSSFRGVGLSSEGFPSASQEAVGNAPQATQMNDSAAPITVATPDLPGEFTSAVTEISLDTETRRAPCTDGSPLGPASVDVSRKSDVLQLTHISQAESERLRSITPIMGEALAQAQSKDDTEAELTPAAMLRLRSITPIMGEALADNAEGRSPDPDERLRSITPIMGEALAQLGEGTRRSRHRPERTRTRRLKKTPSEVSLQAAQQVLRTIRIASAITGIKIENDVLVDGSVTFSAIIPPEPHARLQWVKNVKSSSSQARLEWLNGGRTSLAQLGYIGRALPPGTDSIVKAALTAHKEALSLEHITFYKLLEEARNFVANWCKKLPDAETVMDPGLPNRSSCLESTVRQGGLLGYCIRHERERRGIAPSRALPPIGARELIRLSGEYLCNNPGHPENIVVPLKERGFKCRVVTKSPAGLHAVAHCARKRILEGLRMDRSSKSTLQGFTDEDLFLGCEGEVLVSSDLKAASDRLPLDLMNAMVDGMSRSGKFPPLEIQALRKCASPMLLKYPDGSEIVSKRGILMGLPTTWCLLSLVHLFWWRRAFRVCGVPPAEQRFAICGDDAIALCNRDVADAYLTVVTACGGELSPGKHFVSSGRLRRGVFLERLFTVPDPLSLNRVEQIERCPAVPLRSLVNLDPGITASSWLNHSAIPRQLKGLLSVDAIWSQSDAMKEPLIRFLRNDTSFYQYAAKVGLKNGLKMEDGGSGLPTEFVVTDPERQSAIKVLRDFGYTLLSLLRAESDPRWRQANSKLTTALEALRYEDNSEFDLSLSPIPRLITDHHGPIPPKAFALGQLGSLMKRSVTSLNQSITLNSSPDDLGRTVRIRKADVVKAVKRMEELILQVNVAGLWSLNTYVFISHQPGIVCPRPVFDAIALLKANGIQGGKKKALDLARYQAEVAETCGLSGR